MIEQYPVHKSTLCLNQGLMENMSVLLRVHHVQESANGGHYDL